MQVVYTLSNSCHLEVVDKYGGHWTYVTDSTEFSTLFQKSRDIINGMYGFHTEEIEAIYIIDVDTGEVLAECKPEVEDYGDWDNCDDDCGFDPYLGCYTDDC